jgi:hypothetical protein
MTTSERPVPLEGVAELRRSLRELGQSETNPPHRGEAELAREQRMVASMDAEVSRLVTVRARSRRFGAALLSAAALLLLWLGSQRFVPGAASLSISKEPLATKTSAAPANVEVPSAPSVPTDAVASRLRPPLRTVTPSATPAAPASVTPPQSTLAEENQWFKEAAEASRRGDVNGALGRLEQLLQEHPQSPLAQTALVRKFRLLAKAGRSDEAQREAERYLAMYPTGFAVTEAQAIQQRTQPPDVSPREEPIP